MGAADDTHRGRAEPRVTSPVRPFVVPMTCVLDGHEHAISDSDIADSSGRYRAMCGHITIPGSLAEPPGPRCTACTSVLNAHRSRDGATGRPYQQLACWVCTHLRQKQPSYFKSLIS
jgi:hypothetical protein